MACLSSGVVPSETRPLSIHFIPAPEEEVRVGALGCFPRSRYKPLFRNCFSIRNDQSICLQPTAPSTRPDRQYFFVWPDQGNKLDWDTFNLSPCSESLGGSATDYIPPTHTHAGKNSSLSESPQPAAAAAAVLPLSSAFSSSSHACDELVSLLT